MGGWLVIETTSIHPGGTAMQPTLVIELVPQHRRLTAIHRRGKSTRPTR